MRSKQKKNNYVNNEKLYEHMVVYKTALKTAKSENKRLPQIDNYIGECFLLIANRLATKPQFSGYSFKDDMISDGIENCVNYIDNFDETKYNNPFAYFTMIIWRAFLRRIWVEKKHQYIKYKMIEKKALSNNLVDMQDDEFFSAIGEMNNDQVSKVIVEFEAKMKPSVKTQKKKGVEVFIQEDA